MVQLPKEDVDSRETAFLMFRHRKYKFFFSRAPEELLELEQMAETAATVASDMRMTYKARQHAINKLRSYFNMEFKMYCRKCGSRHYQDEITAPER